MPHLFRVPTGFYCVLVKKGVKRVYDIKTQII